MSRGSPTLLLPVHLIIVVGHGVLFGGALRRCERIRCGAGHRQGGRSVGARKEGVRRRRVGRHESQCNAAALTANGTDPWSGVWLQSLVSPAKGFFFFSPWVWHVRIALLESSANRRFLVALGFWSVRWFYRYPHQGSASIGFFGHRSTLSPVWYRSRLWNFSPTI